MKVKFILIRLNAFAPLQNGSDLEPNGALL